MARRDKPFDEWNGGVEDMVTEWEFYESPIGSGLFVLIRYLSTDSTRGSMNL